MGTRIPRFTTIKEAAESCAAARLLFIRHETDLLARCVRMYDPNTLGGVEEWCDIAGVRGLIVDLNGAIVSGRAEASTIPPAAAPVLFEAS